MPTRGKRAFGRPAAAVGAEELDLRHAARDVGVGVEHRHRALEQAGQRVVVGRQPHEVGRAGGVEHEAKIREAADGSAVPRVADSRVGRGIPPTDRLGVIGGGVVGDDELEIGQRLAEDGLDRARDRGRAVVRRHADRDAAADAHRPQAGRTAATIRRRTVGAAASAATAASAAAATSHASRAGAASPSGIAARARPGHQRHGQRGREQPCVPARQLAAQHTPVHARHREAEHAEVEADPGERGADPTPGEAERNGRGHHDQQRDGVGPRTQARPAEGELDDVGDVHERVQHGPDGPQAQDGGGVADDARGCASTAPGRRRGRRSAPRPAAAPARQRAARRSDTPA